MSLSNYSAQAILNSLLGKTSAFGALASRPTIYVGVSSTDPGETGSGATEPSGGGYARAETEAADWNAASSADPSEATNANVVELTSGASADWLAGSNLAYVVLYDASSGGNFLGSGPLDDPKPVLNGDPCRFPVGALKIALD